MQITIRFSVRFLFSNLPTRALYLKIELRNTTDRLELAKVNYSVDTFGFAAFCFILKEKQITDEANITGAKLV